MLTLWFYINQRIPPAAFKSESRHKIEAASADWCDHWSCRDNRFNWLGVASAGISNMDVMRVRSTYLPGDNQISLFRRRPNKACTNISIKTYDYKMPWVQHFLFIIHLILILLEGIVIYFLVQDTHEKLTLDLMYLKCLKYTPNA